MPGKNVQANRNIKPKSYLLTDILVLVYTIAHWSGPPRKYVYFSQDRQGRLVYVRMAVAAPCTKI